jgi:hypothetical protein
MTKRRTTGIVICLALGAVIICSSVVAVSNNKVVGRWQISGARLNTEVGVQSMMSRDGANSSTRSAVELDTGRSR